MRLKFKGLVLLITVILLGGCTSLPPLDFTVQDVGPIDNRKDAELRSLTVGFAPQAQHTGKVEANHEVPPIWKEALTDALNRSLAFRDDTKMKVNLSVRIVEADAPAFGASMTTQVGAIYEIVDRKNGDLLFSELITTQGVVPFDYAFVGLVRARESINRSIRNNIAEFINRLELVNFNQPTIKNK
jgi:predicted small lipoprotein YifL